MLDQLTELSHWKEKARRPFQDYLTGLYTRKFYDEAIKKAVAGAGRFNQPLSLIILDIDHFKDVNDHYGHPAGDRY